jgi:UDP-N-acetylmuramate dehydrogenase
MRIRDPRIVAKLAQISVEHRQGAALADLTSLGIGGTTDLLRVKIHETLPELLNLLDTNHVPYKFLGGGSNLLVGDGELPWVVLQLVRPEPDVVLDGKFAHVDAAADLGRMITFCAKNDLGGMEGLIGVPARLVALCG